MPAMRRDVQQQLVERTQEAVPIMAEMPVKGMSLRENTVGLWVQPSSR
jgi:hypothetical protein